MPVRVGVTVRVAQLHEAAKAMAVPDACDRAVVHRDYRGACAPGDANPVGPRAGVGRVGLGASAGNREATLHEPAERVDQVARKTADRARAREHGVRVPVGVVVGEDRPAKVGLRAGGAQVAPRREDRVDRVVGIRDPVPVGIDAVAIPGRRHELHPPDRTGRAHVEIAAVVGLDLVDRRQHLPAHAVLDAGGLVDREQERRDAEVVDGEVGHANRQRAQRGEQRRRRVDGEGAGGRRDWSVGRDRSVGSRRSVLGLRRLGVRIRVPV